MLFSRLRRNTTMTSISKDLPPLPPPEVESTEDQPPKHHGLFKRLTTKLRKPSEPLGHDGAEGPQDESQQGSGSRRRHQYSARKHSQTTPNLENAWTSPEQRNAALRARGLLPAQAQPFKDSHGFHLPLSEQEQQLDARVAVEAPVPRQSDERESEAGKIAEAWMKKNLEAGGSATHSPSSRSLEQPQAQGMADCRSSRSSCAEPTRSVASPRAQAAPPPAKAGTPPSRSYTTPQPAFLEREPQASKLLDAMKSYRPPPGRAPAASRTRRYPADSDSSSGSDSD